MATERLKSPRARLFVALDLPAGVRDRIEGWQREAIASEPALRAPASETLHVTLCFLGYVAERRIEEIEAIVLGLEPRPVEMRFEVEPVAVPPRRPRLYAANAPSEAAERIAADVCGRLEKARLYRPEKRPFWPHVTVARVRRNARVRSAPPELPGALAEPFEAVRVALYRSILRPQGAEYVSLAGLDLPSRDGAKKE
jgi:RNA 2',3'-cyclic 3'-phosphodiesterase